MRLATHSSTAARLHTELVLDSWEVVRDGAAALLMLLPCPLPGLTTPQDVQPLVCLSRCCCRCIAACVVRCAIIHFTHACSITNDSQPTTVQMHIHHQPQATTAVTLLSSPRQRDTDAGCSLLMLLFHTYVQQLGWSLCLCPSVYVTTGVSSVDSSVDAAPVRGIQQSTVTFLEGLLAWMQVRVFIVCAGSALHERLCPSL